MAKIAQRESLAALLLALALAGGWVHAGGGAAPDAVGAASARPVRVDLSRDGIAELQVVPGVGPTVAGAVLAERDRRAGYQSLSEVLGVKGVGETLYLSMCRYVEVQNGR
ncbi:MAG: helix-hairpin-helix domain-containing protein [Planctomycetes bacterium]|nr:helix-hairpin-helix domain-containing protein [Planctomycetota bacterium]